MGRGNHGNREERDARVKRMLQASMAKEKEMLKRRMLKEKEFQEAEQRIKRKRDRSRDRQVEGKKSRSSPHHARSPVSQQSKNSDDESDGNESGEEESEEGEPREAMSAAVRQTLHRRQTFRVQRVIRQSGAAGWWEPEQWS